MRFKRNIQHQNRLIDRSQASESHYRLEDMFPCFLALASLSGSISDDMVLWKQFYHNQVLINSPSSE